MLTRTTCGLSVRRPNERIGFFSSSVRPSDAIGSPASSAAWTRLTSVELLELGLAVGPGLLDAGLQPLGAVGDDAQVGEEHLVAEGGEVGRRVAAGEGAEDDQEGVPLADQGEPLGVVAVRAGHQAGRVEHLDGGRGHLLRLVQRGQEVEPGVGQRGDPHLARVDLARVGRRPGQELEQRALAAPGEPDQSDSHGPAFLSGDEDQTRKATRARRPGRGDPRPRWRGTRSAISPAKRLHAHRANSPRGVTPAWDGGSPRGRRAGSPGVSRSSGDKLELAEPDAIEGVDDQARDVGHGLGARPAPGQEDGGPAGELGLRLGRRALQAELGQQLRQSPVEDHAGRERRRVLVGRRGTSGAARCQSQSPALNSPTRISSDRERDEEPAAR